MRVYALCNNKGGVTKTTTTVNLGYGLARHGRRVLIVDADAQCNTTYTLLGEIVEEESATLFDVIIGINRDQRNRRSLADIIVPVKQQENLFLAPGSIGLSAADILLSTVNGREKTLKRALEPLRNDFDYVLIDTPPTLGLMPVNAIVAAGSAQGQQNGLVIPICPQIYSVLGISILEDALAEMREQMEIPIPIFGVLCANVQQTNNARERLRQVQDHFGDTVLSPVVPRNEKVEEAADMQIPLYKYAPRSTGAIAYTKLTNAFMYRAGDITRDEMTTWNNEEEAKRAN